MDNPHGSRIENGAEAAVFIAHHAAAFPYRYITNRHHREAAVVGAESGTTGLDARNHSVLAPSHELTQVSVCDIARGLAFGQGARVSLRSKARKQLSFDFRRVAMAEELGESAIGVTDTPVLDQGHAFRTGMKSIPKDLEIRFVGVNQQRKWLSHRSL